MRSEYPIGGLEDTAWNGLRMFFSENVMSGVIAREFSDVTDEFNANGGIDGVDCPEQNGFQSVLAGFFCSGHKCRGLPLQCTYGSLMIAGHIYSTLGLSEEGGLHNCPPDYMITGMKCTGRLCDNTHLECKEMTNKGLITMNAINLPN